MDISQEGSRPYNRINARQLHLVGKSEDYVPLFTIYRPHPAIVDARSLPDSPLKDRMLELTRQSPSRTLLPIEKLLISKSTEASVDGFDYYKDFLKEYKNSVKTMIDDDDLEYQIKVGPESGNSYKDLFTNITKNNYWQLTNLRSGKYITNLWFVATAEPANTSSSAITEHSEITTLFCLMVKREMIPYLRMCYLLGEEPHPDALELWVRDDLDVPNGAYKNLRSRYRKEMKKTIVDSGIEIVEMPSLDDVMYHKINSPKFKRMSERREWYAERSAEFLQSLSEKKRIARDSAIELVA